jgi:hypothetical protein
MTDPIKTALEALKFVVDRFGPNKRNYLFSQRLALDKAEAAIKALEGLAAQPQGEVLPNPFAFYQIIQEKNAALDQCRRLETIIAELEEKLDAAPQPAMPVVPQEMRVDFTDTARAALLWVLWHHQGSSSKVGQPIRFALGMGAHDHLNDHQVAEAKRWASISRNSMLDAAPPIKEGGENMPKGTEP